MAKFDDVLNGATARKRIELPLDGAHWDPEKGAYVGGVVLPLDVRVLSPAEWADVLSSARAFATARGVEVEEATPGNELYDYGLKLHAVAIAATDCDSPKDDPQPFFPGGPAQILASRRLLPEHVALLFAEWEQWQAACNPRALALSPEEWLATSLGIAKSSESDALRFFLSMSPGTQWRYVRSTVCQLVALLPRSSTSGASSPESAPSAPSNDPPTQPH